MSDLSAPTNPTIRVEVRHVPSADMGLPPLAVQVTKLVGSYMLWVGVSDGGPEDVEQAPLKGNLARDWACAMPAINVPATATSLYRSSSSDAALGMSQRLARRFKKQIFLSIDVPPAFNSMGQGSRLVLEVERALVSILKEDEQ